MHIGDKKARYLNDAICLAQQSCEKDVFLEIGSYCGYSSCIIAQKLRSNGKLFSVEASVKCVEWTQRLLRLTQLSESVEVIHGNISSAIPYFKQLGVTFGLVFIDHDKSLYLSDLILLERSGLLRPGTVVVADNVLMNPMGEYLAHVRDPSGPYSSSTLHRSTVEYAAASEEVSEGDPLEDGVEVSVYRGGGLS